MPPLQAQIDEQKRRLDAHEDRMDDADTMRAQTHSMVAEIHHALMEPQYGHGDKSLLQRMAEVTVAIESGDRAAENLTKWAKRLAFIGTLLAVLGGAFLKLSVWRDGP